MGKTTEKKKLKKAEIKKQMLKPNFAKDKKSLKSNVSNVVSFGDLSLMKTVQYKPKKLKKKVSLEITSDQGWEVTECDTTVLKPDTTDDCTEVIDTHKKTKKRLKNVTILDKTPQTRNKVVSIESSNPNECSPEPAFLSKIFTPEEKMPADSVDIKEIIKNSPTVLNKETLALEVEEEEETEDINQPRASFKVFATEYFCIAIIEKAKKLSFHGCFQCCVIHGTIEIFGFNIDSEDQTFYPLYSLKGQGFLGLQAKEHADSVKKICSVLTENFKIERKLAMHIQNLVHKNDSVVVLKPIENPSICFIQERLNEKLLSSDLGSEAEQKLQTVFSYQNPTWNMLTENKKWDIVFENFMNGDKKPAVICGGKGAGKTTLMRFLVNKSIKTLKKVLVLDLDIGQSEFTAPGCISAVMVESPLLGPNYTHFKKPIKSYLIGQVNVMDCLQRYVDCIEKLFDFVAKDPAFHGVPCLVNCFGMTKKTGLDIAMTVIKLAQPKLVVHMKTNDPNRDFPRPLTVDEVKAHKTTLIRRQIRTNRLSYVTVIVDSMVSSEKGQLSSRRCRELAILSYMGPNSKTYQVKLSSLKLYTVEGQNKNMAAVVNGNLVAVCKSSSNDDELFPTNCIGFGIVRGADLIRNELYLLSPLDGATLDNADSLVMCNAITLPDIVYTNFIPGSGLVPYVSASTPTTLLSQPSKKMAGSASQSFKEEMSKRKRKPGGNLLKGLEKIIALSNG